MKDYELVYEEFWKDVVEDDDGNIDIDQVKKELSDFHTLMKKVPLVYDLV